MEQLLQDLNDSLDLLREKRMQQIWIDNEELKQLANQESDAERKFQKLELNTNEKAIVDALISCINEVDNYCEKLIYRQGLKDGYRLAKFADNMQ